MPSITHLTPCEIPRVRKWLDPIARDSGCGIGRHLGVSYYLRAIESSSRSWNDIMDVVSLRIPREKTAILLTFDEITFIECDSCYERLKLVLKNKIIYSSFRARKWYHCLGAVYEPAGEFFRFITETLTHPPALDPCSQNDCTIGGKLPQGTCVARVKVFFKDVNMTVEMHVS